MIDTSAASGVVLREGLVRCERPKQTMERGRVGRSPGGEFLDRRSVAADAIIDTQVGATCVALETTKALDMPRSTACGEGRMPSGGCCGRFVIGPLRVRRTR
jgi:hypothetical protein